MDTVDFSIYNNSIFLDVNKFKVRYRTYSSDNSIYEEIKTNTMNGKGKFVTKTRFKSFDDISNKVFKKLLLKPSLMVEYERSYYKYKNLRITVDEKLNFISKFEIIITNAYHGLYWATLLGKKVICIPNKSGLFTLRYKPVYLTKDDVINNELISKEFDDVLFVPNLKGIN